MYRTARMAPVSSLSVWDETVVTTTCQCTHALLVCQEGSCIKDRLVCVFPTICELDMAYLHEGHARDIHRTHESRQTNIAGVTYVCADAYGEITAQVAYSSITAANKGIVQILLHRHDKIILLYHIRVYACVITLIYVPMLSKHP